MKKVSLRDRNNNEITSFKVMTESEEEAFKQGKRSADIHNGFRPKGIVYGIAVDGKYKDLKDIGGGE